MNVETVQKESVDQIDINKVFRWIDKFNRILYKNILDVHKDELDEYIQDGIKLLKFLRQRFEILKDSNEGMDIDDVDVRMYDYQKTEQKSDT